METVLGDPLAGANGFRLHRVIGVNGNKAEIPIINFQFFNPAGLIPLEFKTQSAPFFLRLNPVNVRYYAVGQFGVLVPAFK